MMRILQYTENLHKFSHSDLFPFVPSGLATFEAGRGGDEHGEDDESAASDGDVQDGNAELEGAVSFLLVEAGRAVPGPVTPKLRADAGVQFGTPTTAKEVNELSLENKSDVRS